MKKFQPKVRIAQLASLSALFAGWWAATYLFKVPSYVLPKPVQVWDALWQGYVDGTLWKHLFYTLQSTTIGYLAGCAFGFVLGLLLAESTTLERVIYPYIIALQSMPKVALAPLIIMWFGLGLESKIVMVSLICFFPVLVNTFIGLRQADEKLIELYRAYGASRFTILRHVKLPAAAGSVFAGLQISVALGLIGAVVSEFIASQRGLGNVIQSASINMDAGLMFAALFSLAAIGTLGSQLIRYLHWRVVFWDRRSDEPSTVTTS
jgi:NitT/TauT family transport system permease protein